MSSVLASIIEVQALSLTLCMLCHHMLENNDAATKLSRRRAPSAASPPRRLSVLRLLLVNHTLKIGGEIMADAPTNLMAKYYVQESSGDYSSQSVSIFMMETSGTLER